MGIDFDKVELDKIIQKIKKTINLECNTLHLIDEDILSIRRKQEQETLDANFKLSEEVKNELAQLEMKISCSIDDLNGGHKEKDEISLLDKVAIKYF